MTERQSLSPIMLFVSIFQNIRAQVTAFRAKANLQPKLLAADMGGKISASKAVNVRSEEEPFIKLVL